MGKLQTLCTQFFESSKKGCLAFLLWYIAIGLWGLRGIEWLTPDDFLRVCLLIGWCGVLVFAATWLISGDDHG